MAVIQTFVAVYRCGSCSGLFHRAIPVPPDGQRFRADVVLEEVRHVQGLQSAVHTCFPTVSHIAGLGTLVGVRELRQKLPEPEQS